MKKSVLDLFKQFLRCITHVHMKKSKMYVKKVVKVFPIFYIEILSSLITFIFMIIAVCSLGGVAGSCFLFVFTSRIYCSSY